MGLNVLSSDKLPAGPLLNGSMRKTKATKRAELASQKTDKTESMYSCLTGMKPKSQACV